MQKKKNIVNKWKDGGIQGRPKSNKITENFNIYTKNY